MQDPPPTEFIILKYKYICNTFSLSYISHKGYIDKGNQCTLLKN